MSSDTFDLSNWVDGGISERIILLARLKTGWHYGEGTAISNEAVKVCLRIIAVYENMGCATNAFPLMHGGIVLNIYRPTEVLEIEIYDGNQEISYERIDGAL